MSRMSTAIAQRARGALSDPQEPGRSISSGWDTTLDLSQDALDPVLPEHILAAVEASLDAGETHYTDRPGLPALRQAISKKLAAEQNFRLEVSREVVISCGEREGVFLALQAWLTPGDEVLIPDPGPAYLAEAVRLSGGVVVPVPLSVDRGFVMRASQIEDAFTPRARVLVLANPSDPTGAVIPADEMAKIAGIAATHDLRVVSIEGMDESLSGQVSHTSIASFPQGAERTIIVGSFSGLYGLSAWRVGYFAGPHELVTPVRDLKQAMSICTSAMAQYAALAVMTGPADWLRARRDMLAQNRALVTRALDALALPHSHPALGPFVFADIRETGMTSVEFAGWLMRRAQVVISPGTRYGDGGEGYVRISVWTSPSAVEQAMRRIRWAIAWGREERA